MSRPTDKFNLKSRFTLRTCIEQLYGAVRNIIFWRSTRSIPIHLAGGGSYNSETVKLLDMTSDEGGRVDGKH
jgi:hypothetical protein